MKVKKIYKSVLQSHGGGGGQFENFQKHHYGFSNNEICKLTNYHCNLSTITTSTTTSSSRIRRSSTSLLSTPLLLRLRSSSSSSSSSIRLVLLLLLTTTLLMNHNVQSFSLTSVTPTTQKQPTPTCPEYSPATGLKNQFYIWKEGQKIRYQTTKIDNNEHDNNDSEKDSIVFIHGLFVNSDHWRKSLLAFKNNNIYDAYALDLYGCGYSDKPPANSDIAQRCNGENSIRFPNDNDKVLKNIQLGTPNGQKTRTVNVELCHPLHSPYNFYTWADLICDFCTDIVNNKKSNNNNNNNKKITLVCNSIGTISALQAVIDQPELYNGVFIVCPNFRELHSAEVPYATITMPILRVVQRLLRDGFGQHAFDALAKPSIVKNILNEPYAITSAIDDELVQVLLDPLLTPGASNVVFDTLSYSAGPLPEQQLQMFPSKNTNTNNNIPVWVCYGDLDPWTPGQRVESMIKYTNVEKVIKLNGVGHCPHDEAPDQVDAILFDFLRRIKTIEQQ